MFLQPFIKSALICLILSAGTLIFADDAKDSSKSDDTAESQHEYTGFRVCRMCHSTDGIFKSWQQTAHATAWDSLSDMQKKMDGCRDCHATGLDEEGELLANVQCEACHGPGSDYIKMSIMRVREKAVANGLIIGDEKTCRICHTDSLPPECGSTTEFDYAKMKENGIHALPYNAKEDSLK